MTRPERGLLGKKVTIVVGGAGGIGRAIVARFRVNGAKVTCIDLRTADVPADVLPLRQILRRRPAPSPK